MNTKRKVILYIACSLDGFISGPGDDLSFLELAEQEGEDYGYADFMKTIDTVVLGRRTYEWVMKHVPVFPHADKQAFIITRTPRPSIGKTIFYSGDPESLILQLKNDKGKNIFIDGGAELVNSLLQKKLIDEMILSVIPVLLGDGIRLFSNKRPEQSLKLISAKTFKKGLVQLHYAAPID